MALPSSGALALSDFNTELGNSAGTQINLDASAVRALIGKSSGAVASFSDYYGASSSLYSATMTVGQLVVAGQYGSTNHGFNDSSESGLFSGVSGGDFGSLTSRNASGFSNSGATVEALFHTTGGTGIRLVISDNTALSNSGWSTLTIGSSSLSRTSASFAQGSAANNLGGGQGFRGTWTWSNESNLFGTSGTKSISIT